MELDSRKLCELGRDIKTPFVISIVVYGSNEVCEFQCLEILRLLPGKRVVVKARFKSQEVVLKIFLRQGKAKCDQELDGYQLLLELGIPTPPVVVTGQVSDRLGYVIAYKFISDSKSLLQIWNDSIDNIAVKVALIRRVMPIMARLHTQSLLQKDIHLGNFLITNDNVYIIDAADIVMVAKSKRYFWIYLENLALFFAQLEQCFDDYVEDVFDIYIEKIDYLSKEELATRSRDKLVHYLRKKITKQRTNRVKQYIKKIFRDSTEFVSKKMFFYYCVYARDAASWGLQSLVENIDREFANGCYIKQGNTAEVVEYQLAGHTVIIKKYRAHRLKYWLRRCWRKGRAWKSWENACRLKMLGIDSVKPLALIEKRIGFITLDSYFISEKIKGANAKEYYDDNVPNEKQLEAFYMLFKMLFKARLIHGDMKATNFIMYNEKPIIIDLDSMRMYSKNLDYGKAFRKELIRFMDNWQDRPDIERRFSESIVKRLSENSEVRL